MNFYMDVQFVEERKENGGVFEVVFSNYSDDKKIEKIIAGGLNSFQKRNPYIQVEDGFIEFFEDNSIKLRIECTCKYPLSKRRIEDLKQELVLAFKMTSEERARLETKVQVESKDKTVLAALQEMKEEWNRRLSSQVGELKQEFTKQLSVTQAEMRQQLQETGEAHTLGQKELQETVALEHEMLTDHLQEILQKEKSLSSQLKKRVAGLETSLVQRDDELKTALANVYKETSAGNFEKIDFLKEKLSSEIDENNFELKEEIGILRKKIDEDAQGMTVNIQHLEKVFSQADTSAEKREEQLNKQFSDLSETISQLKEEHGPLTAAIEKKEETLFKKIDGFENAVAELSEKVQQLQDNKDQPIIDKVNELKESLNDKLEEEIKKINETVHQQASLSAEEGSENEQKLAFEKQLLEMKKLVTENLNKITPLFSTLQKENIMLSRKIDSLEVTVNGFLTIADNAVVEKPTIEETEEPKKEIKEDVTKNVKEEVKVEAKEKIEPVIQVSSAPEPDVECPEPAATEKKTEEKKIDPVAPTPKEKLSPLKPAEPERRIKKIGAKEDVAEKEKTTITKREQAKVQRLLPKTDAPVETKPKVPRERPTVNPFLADFQQLEQRFLELDKSQRFDKPVRLSKFDYRKSITHVHYIEYRWENVVLDKEDYDFFGLETFESRINELPEFLIALKSDNKKESLFNQNSFRLKKSVWEKIKTYHLLSIYLEDILTLRKG